MTIENPMINYPQERLTYLQSMEIAAYYAERRRMPVKQQDKPCIQPVHRTEGGRFHAKG